MTVLVADYIYAHVSRAGNPDIRHSALTTSDTDDSKSASGCFNQSSGSELDSDCTSIDSDCESVESEQSADDEDTEELSVSATKFKSWVRPEYKYLLLS